MTRLSSEQYQRQSHYKASNLADPGIDNIVTVTVNDGGDDSGIARDNSGLMFETDPDPSTFLLPTAADSNVMGTLTLTGTRVGETFTLNATSSGDVLADASRNVALTFSDERPPTDSNETLRTITIRIMNRGLTLLAIDDSATSETLVENDDGRVENNFIDGQKYIGVYPAETDATAIIEVAGGTPDEFSITGIELTITGGNGVAVVRPDPDPDNSPPPFTRSGNEFTFSGGIEIEVAERFINSLEFGIASPEPTGATTPPPASTEVAIVLTITYNDNDITNPILGRGASADAVRTINEEPDPFVFVFEPVQPGQPELEEEVDPDTGERLRLARGSPADFMAAGGRDFPFNVNGGGDSDITMVTIDGPTTFPLPAAEEGSTGTLTVEVSLSTVSEVVTLTVSSDVLLADADVMITLIFTDDRGVDETRTITIRIRSDAVLPTLSLSRDIEAIPDATRVALRVNSAYDEVGIPEDSNNTFTRDVDYVITFTRIGDKQPSAETVTIPAARANIVIPNPAGLTEVTVRAGLDTAKIFKSEPSPAFLPIEILLTRNDVTLLPGDSYMVDISVRDRAGNPDAVDATAATMYVRQTFTMETDGAYDELDS